MIGLSNRKILNKSFYLREDVVEIAKELLGKVLCTNKNGRLTAGMIIETEAYAGIYDKASHAYGNRRTKRTEVMYQEGGVAYVYLCYGIHSLFNVVTNQKNIPHAVLIRGILPVAGKEIMLERAGKSKDKNTLGKGPGKLSKILGIDHTHTGTSLTSSKADSNFSIWLEDRGISIKTSNILVNKRIGIDYAKEDALLPYRFTLKNPNI